jgi:hypothetical protein
LILFNINVKNVSKLDGCSKSLHLSCDVHMSTGLYRCS